MEFSTNCESPPPDPHLPGLCPGPPRYASACLGQASRGSPGTRGFTPRTPRQARNTGRQGGSLFNRPIFAAKVPFYVATNTSSQQLHS